MYQYNQSIIKYFQQFSNWVQSKAHNFHMLSIPSPCDNSLQATDVWHCDGKTQPLTLLKSTALQQVQKNLNQPTNNNNKKEIKKNTSVLMHFSLAQHCSTLEKWSQGLNEYFVW